MNSVVVARAFWIRPWRSFCWRPLLSLLLILGGGGCPSIRAQEAAWKLAPAPLGTRWSKEVSPEKARPEYPRPTAVRKEWKSLNGLWEFAFDDANAGRAAGWSSHHPLPEKILVPWTFEASLSGIGRGKEVHERVWYRRSFALPSAWQGRRALLHFGAVDWESTVWVNGTEVGTHRGGYTPFTYDITDALKAEGPQEVVVAVYDPADPKTNGWQPKGKQLGSQGIWYTRTTGIWQSVWLEPVSAFHITEIALEPTLTPDGKSGQLKGHIAATREPGSFGSFGPFDLDIRLLRNGKEIRTVTIHSTGLSPIADTSTPPPATPHRYAEQGREIWGESANGMPSDATPVLTSPALWSPESPALYDVKLALKVQGRIVDEVTSYCAFRRVGIANGRLTLNDRPYFYRGVLDQGYWPDGILTPPTDDAIRNDVEMIKKLGFNMARKHVKIEDPRWYYWCDRLGVAVWQDMPSSHNLNSDEAKQNFVQEWRAAIAATRAHPCVVHWIPFNENWGNPKEFQDQIVQLTRQLDPTRPITDASGWTQRGLTDVIDAHDYSNHLIAQGVQNPVKPKVVGEFGGIALPVADHTWTTGWGYQTVRDPEGLVRRIRHQTSQLFEAANLSGFVYTQLTDVEQELNGLMTYDRLPKADPKRVAAVFEGISRVAQGGFLRDWLVLGPLPAETALRSAVDSPENRAVMARLLAKAYLPNEEALQPVENSAVMADGKTLMWRPVHLSEDQLDFHNVFGGANQNAVAYAVAYIDSPREVKNATLLMGSDDGAVVWLNGKKIWTIARIRGVGLDDDVIGGLTLKAGRNVLVVKVGQGVGGWGLAARFELPDGSVLRPAAR